jgi:glycine/sarcosine N-methyltransferase
MDFYQSIAGQYDYIFPFDKPQHDFVAGSLPLSGEKRILDLGCGTGSLDISLVQSGYDVVGIDLDAAMIEMAVSKGKALPNLTFRQMDMRDIGKEFSPSSFDIMICFGNTLVHLPARDDVLSVLKEANALLRQKGKFLLQILNYDHILEVRMPGLPSIDNEFVRFDRNYFYHKDGSITFATQLTDKSNGRIIKNEVSLFPLRKAELETMLNDAGFRNVRFYGDFRKNPPASESLPLVAEAW